MTRFVYVGLPLIVLFACGFAEAQTGEAKQETRAGQDAARSAPAEYWLRVKGERVNLRSRADANSLAVARLDKDTVLRGTGSAYGWHTVRPPKGVFSLVSAEYVDRRSDEKGIVSVRGGNLRVRVGSALREIDPLRVSEVQTLLPRGTEVRILGRQGDWLKIVPPKEVRFFVSAEFVERISDDAVERLRAIAAARAARSDKPGTGELASDARSNDAPDMSGTWGQRLVMIETAIQAEARKPLERRSWTETIARLKPISEQRAEPRVARLATGWVTKLEARQVDEAALRAAQGIVRREEREQSRFKREMEHIQRARGGRAAQPEFVAVGQLLLTNPLLMRDGVRRFTLRDPITRRVVAYVEFPAASKLDPKPFDGKYVGLRGERRLDATLKTDIVRVAEIVELTAPRPTSRPARGTP